MSNGYREVKLIKVKRQPIDLLNGRDKFGHWWIEIGNPKDANSESYGWWPVDNPSPIGKFFSVAGELNGSTNQKIGKGFTNPPPRDPRHSTRATVEFHPVVPISDTRTDDEIADCLREFAAQYSGRWRWFFGWGQNCHTFQREALRHCGLLEKQS